MSIRVSSNQMMYNYKKQLNEANSEKDKLLEQGDGNKLHRPSDDSVAYTKYLRYDTSSQENTQYQENVSTGVSWMKASDSALVSMTNIQTTFKEKTVAAANDTNNTSDRAAIGKEMMAEIQELVSLGNTMQGDRYLFAGQKDTTMPFSMSEIPVTRGQAKTLDDKASAYFSGTGAATSAGSIKQMLTLKGSDGNTYYLNTKDGYIYTQNFVEKGYKDKVAENANAVVDPSVDSVGQLSGWGGSTPTEKVSNYFKNTGEIINASATLSGATNTAGNTEGVNASSLTFEFKTLEQKIVTYQGDAKYISMTKKNGTTEPTSDTVNVNGQDIWGTDIFDNADSGNTASGTAMLNSMLTVHAKVVGEDVLYLKDDAQTLADEAHSTTVNTETKLGARQQLYDSVKTMLGNQQTLIQGDITDVMSADVAQLATKLMEQQTVYNMSLALGARILPSSLADYL
ncbi:flagellar hook-associated protein FlgL [uncultured Selenomonas sp.]|uniref:flagellar hook-associated protein FlgL n=1 Tax=uncultured Selenomonas sp. TaxID=159275 RepID=UPI0025D34CCC|nr:flagellar hook-associated protein FlgL [uncultured Selenomonas sp.]